MIQFIIGLIIGIAITVFAIALTSIDDEERRK